MKNAFIVALILLAFLSSAQSQSKFGALLQRAYTSMNDTTRQIILVTFANKGTRTYAPEDLISTRAIMRRRKVRPLQPVIDNADFPLEQSYVQAVQTRVISVRHQLKWFNAVSAWATKSQIDKLLELSFVREIDLVGRWKAGHSKDQLPRIKSVVDRSRSETVSSLDYGSSYRQLQQINVPAVHDLGIFGQGILICMFDEGVRNTSDPLFDSMNIVATYDFVDHKTSVIPEDPGAGGHGEATLATIGGYATGNFIGPAFRASFLLARTENDSSETPIEEDNWAKGIEWADSIGVDVTSTSLAYLVFDPPYPSLTWHDMNGTTALITRAGDRADSLGIVVVNAAGNAGRDSTHNTLWAPADGFNIITVGAVDTAGVVMGFSSNGPTVDGRIKPDVMAMGMGGTSFACPLAAGVAALILCANPGLRPEQVRMAMRNTASDASSPDNFHGWGIVDALAAVNYFGITNHMSGTLFEDRNGNGKRNIDEAFLTGMKVRLGGQKIDSVLTDAHGKFLFDNLALGQYTLTIDHPGATIIYPRSTLYTVTLDSTNRIAGNLDFALFQPITIRGRLFIDANGSGTLDQGDLTWPDWPVILSGASSMMAFTDSDGNYAFTGLGPGEYSVRDSLPQLWRESSPGLGISFIITSTSGLDTTLPFFGNAFYPQSPVQVTEGWNMLSPPDRAGQMLKDSVFPTSVSAAFTFINGYLLTDTIQRGCGYWLKFSSKATISIAGIPIMADTIPVNKEWNLIGSISYPVPINSIGSIPSGITTSPFYHFDGDSGYVVADTIEPGYAYWVRTLQVGELILSSSQSASAGSRIHIIPTVEPPPPPPDENSLPNMLPATYSLAQCFPNPFNPTTTIKYELPANSHVSLKIYNLLGQVVQTLKDNIEPAGFKQVEWNASSYASGIYFYRLEATSVTNPGETFTSVKKMVLVR